MKRLLLVAAVMLVAAVALAAPGVSPWVEQYFQYDNRNDQTFRQAVNISATGSLVDAGAPLNIAGNLATLGGRPILQTQSLDAGLYVATLVYGSATVGADAGVPVTFATAFALAPRCQCTSNASLCWNVSASTTAAVFGGTSTETLDILCVGPR